MPRPIRTISFDLNGGSGSYPAASTKNDGKLASLPSPTRSGYTFLGWYNSPSGGVQISVNTVFLYDTTIYAHWRDHNVFTVTFDPNGGSLSTKSALTSEGRLGSLPVPTRKGYTFDGWYTKTAGGNLVSADTVFSSSATVYAHWYAGDILKDSGGLAKLSRKEINALLSGAPTAAPKDVFAQEPSVTAPYDPGRVTGEALNAALKRLNAIRRIAGVPAVKLDDELCESAQYGAVLIAACGRLSHTPPQPDDMENDFYKKGYEAAGSSNLHYGSGGLYGTLAYSVDGFMDDSDASNVDRVGHRRWQLNPKLGKVGFGLAQKGSAGYVCEKVFDQSGTAPDYEFISWPASGNFPSELFGGDTAWSVTLDPGAYAAPQRSKVSVTLSRAADKKSWRFSGSSYTAASSGEYFNVENSGYGVSNCIIFRPGGIESYAGAYTVTIEGLQTRSGAETVLSFQVDFFDADAPDAPAPTPIQNRFTDVVQGAYYAEAVAWAVEQGITKGTSGTTFSPDNPCTRGEIVTFLWRANGSPAARAGSAFSAVPSGAYYTDTVAWAVGRGITSGTGNGAFSPDMDCSRGQIVTFLFRAR